MPTAPRSTSSACSRAGSRPPRRSSSSPTATTRWAGPTRSGRVLGELPRTSVTRLRLEPFSEGAVEDLARPYEVDAVELHRVTGGNPFYVTEALAAGGAALPESVRDAVLARAARLPAGARALLDAVAIAPPRAELWLLEEIAADELAYVEEGLTSGMLRVHRDGIAFRHEIERVAIDETMPPDRRHELHQRALARARRATPPSRPRTCRAPRRGGRRHPGRARVRAGRGRARRRLRRPSRSRPPSSRGRFGSPTGCPAGIARTCSSGARTSAI